MRSNAFHLAWFLQGSSVQAWGERWTGNIAEEWMVPDMFIELARSMDRACFDYILLEDTSYVGEAYGNSRDIYLKYGMSVPRQDPSVVGTLMIAATKHLGIVPTFATYSYPPYLVARLLGSMDQVSQGRAGWNLVTGSSDFVAMNFGKDRLPEHDARYDIAEEYLDVVQKLWDSWPLDSMIADHESGILCDPTKVHAINHEGEYFKVRGPLNSGPLPQGRAVIAQAGGSPRGRRFAARHADTVVAHVKGPEAMKAYRDDIRRIMVEYGRDPDSCKVLFLIAPILADTMEEAQQRASQRAAQAGKHLDTRLAALAKITNIDFSAMDLDAPVGELTTNGHQQSLGEFLRKAGKKTLRQAITEYSSSGLSVDLVGTPESVAAQMGEVMEEAGGDGFLFSLHNVSRRSIAEITDGLVPELQRRCLTRKAYGHKQFRDNLLEF